jgi:hypothetical protein
MLYRGIFAKPLAKKRPPDYNTTHGNQDVLPFFCGRAFLSAKI